MGTAGAFIFILNALFFGTFYANFWSPAAGNNDNHDDFYKPTLQLIISSIKNDAIFNVYIPKTIEYFHFSNRIIQPLFIFCHLTILYRAGIRNLNYILFYAEQTVVLSFFVIGTENHFENISLLFIHFFIVHFTGWVKHKKN